MSKILFICCLIFPVMSYYHVDNMHVEDQMRRKDFDQWTAFRIGKHYGQNCQHFETQWGCASVDGSTVITRADNNGYDYYTLTIQPHQEELFYYLAARDGFYKVDSTTSHYTYTYNANDNGVYDFRERSIPESKKGIYRRKKNFLIGHIQTKLSSIQLPTINKFTLKKIENINVDGMYYEFIVNNEHIMSVNKYQTDLFFQIIEKDFITNDRITYHRK